MSQQSYATIDGLMILENARSISKKVTILDAFVFIGAGIDDLMGSVCYFNNEDTTVNIPDGMYSATIRIAKRDDIHNVYNANEAQYSFIGDLKAYSAVQAGGGQLARATLLGIVTNSDSAKEQFHLDLEQYTLAYTEAKKKAEDTAKDEGTAVILPPRSVFPVLGVFGKSPRYDKKRPVPYLDKLIFMTGFLTGMSEELEGTELKQRFVIEVDDINFLVPPPPGNSSKSSKSATPGPSAGSASRPKSRFAAYSNKRPRTDDNTPPTSSPSPLPK
ncbi:hypothetical protein C8R43DRAFT_942203 [Mycena crocata]|nr:hypothetical protein C8R43DRAFT_942203 [Mycena crocata]